MSAIKRQRQKGRREAGSFIAVPHVVVDSKNWRRCGGTAIKLLLDLARQYKGSNNGDLSPALVRDGPASEAKTRALRELVHYGLLVQTKHGGLLRMPSLYALSWQAIDDCKGKLEIGPTTLPPGNWKLEHPKFKGQVRKSKLPASRIETVTQICTHPSFVNRSVAASSRRDSTSETEHLLRSTKRGIASRLEVMP